MADDTPAKKKGPERSLSADQIAGLLEEVPMQREIRVCVLGEPSLDCRILGLTKHRPSSALMNLLVRQGEPALPTMPPAWLIVIPVKKPEDAP